MALVTVLVAIVILSEYFLAASKFVKDHSTDAHQFPPPLHDPPKGVPMGHLRPLGTINAQM